MISNGSVCWFSNNVAHREYKMYMVFVKGSESESEYEVKVHLTIEAQTARYERSNRYTVPTQLKAKPR